MKKIWNLLPAIGLVAFSMAAKADSTLKVIDFGTGSNGEIGPYTLSLNGTNIQAFCLDDQNFVSQNESWNVKVVSGDNLTSDQKQYAEEAYIFSELGQKDPTGGHSNPTFTNTEVQDALWAIFDPQSENSATDELLNLAANNYQNVDMSLYDFYIPDGGLKGTTGGDSSVPQTFIGLNPDPTSPTPEPSTLALFGSGLLGMAGVVRRKLARA